MFSKFSITWLKDQNDWWSCTFFLYVLTTLAARDWAVAKWERGTWDGIFYFVFLYFVFLYLMFLYFLLLYFASANDWATARWETDFVLLYFATSYLAASDWAIARWEAGDLSCARTEEGFVIRVTNEAGQPSSLFHCCYNRYHHNLNWYDKWCFVTVRVVCTYILGSAMLQVERTPCQGRGWTYNHPQRSDQDRVPWNR